MQAETSREMLGYVTTAPGETKRYSVVVNSRTPEGQPMHAGSPTGTPGLDMYFFGSAGSAGEEGGIGGNTPPPLQSIGYAPASHAVMVYVAGDSTVCDQTDTAFGGWAQFIPQYFDYPVAIANYASSGESSGSFVAKGLWSLITTRWASGDWVIIQFGHNDGGTSPTAFHANITKLVTDALAKGVEPVLVTPPARTNVWNGNVVGPQFVDVVAQMNKVATEQKVRLIDLTAASVKWYDMLGPTGWQKYHAIGTKGLDTTHTNPRAAPRSPRSWQRPSEIRISAWRPICDSSPGGELANRIQLGAAVIPPRGTTSKATAEGGARGSESGTGGP